MSDQFSLKEAQKEELKKFVQDVVQEVSLRLKQWEPRGLTSARWRKEGVCWPAQLDAVANAAGVRKSGGEG